MWDGVASRLVNHFRVVALDLRSHGATEAAEPFSFEAIGRDIDAVIAELKLERAVVVGHSLGGCAAVEYATRPGCLAAVNIDGPVVEMGTLHDEIGEPFDWAKFEDEVSMDHFVGTGDELEKLLDRQLIEGQPLEEETRRRYQPSGRNLWEKRPNTRGLGLSDESGTVRVVRADQMPLIARSPQVRTSILRHARPQVPGLR